MQRSTSKIPIIMDKNPDSVISEAYRGLRTSIEFNNKESMISVIGVTSSQPGEGKTTTAVNLAIAYAQANRRVLLIDANIRQPILHDLFLKPNSRGLTNILVDQSSYLEVIDRTYIENLELMTAGIIPPNPSELLASGRLSELLSALKSTYDTIIIDTPSVLQSTDAHIIAASCDGMLLVVQAGKVKKHTARRTKVMLENVKANLIGVVLNHKKSKSRSDFAY